MEKFSRIFINLSVALVFFHTNSAMAEKITSDMNIKMNTGDHNLVAILVPIAFFAIFPACLFILGYFRQKGRQEKQLTLRAMVENGAQIPPEMFMEGQKDQNPIDRDRRRGLLFTLSSLGFLVFLNLIENLPKGSWSVALIPMFLGIGYLISWKLAEKEANTAQS